MLGEQAKKYLYYLLCMRAHLCNHWPVFVLSSPLKPSPAHLVLVLATATRLIQALTAPSHLQPLPLQAATPTQDWQTAVQLLVSFHLVLTDCSHSSLVDITQYLWFSIIHPSIHLSILYFSRKFLEIKSVFSKETQPRPATIINCRFTTGHNNT